MSWKREFRYSNLSFEIKHWHIPFSFLVSLYIQIHSQIILHNHYILTSLYTWRSNDTRSVSPERNRVWSIWDVDICTTNISAQSLSVCTNPGANPISFAIWKKFLLHCKVSFLYFSFRMFSFIPIFINMKMRDISYPSSYSTRP